LKPLLRFAHALVWSPLLWGTAACCAFYVPLHAGLFHSEFLTRYFASHAVEHVATLLFCVGIAAMVLKYFSLDIEAGIFKTELLDPIPRGGQPVSHAGKLLGRLEKLPFHWHDAYLVRRLREALEYVLRRGDAAKLEEELHYLSELDVSRMHASYSLVKIIIWAIPILGLLGTVIGITKAVANLSPQSIETSITEVTSGLGVAFDHTALALGLSMALMFAQYLIERRENRLLAEVESRTGAELVGRFIVDAGAHNPDLRDVRSMAEAVISATQTLAERQAEIWTAAITAAQQQWQQLTTATGQELQQAVAQSLAKTLGDHATAIITSQQTHTEQQQAQWHQVHAGLMQHAMTVAQQQEEIIRQGSILAAAVQLLSARLGMATGEPRVDGQIPRTKQAA
jgi:hypothetical protein